MARRRSALAPALLLLLLAAVGESVRRSTGPEVAEPLQAGSSEFKRMLNSLLQAKEQVVATPGVTDAVQNMTKMLGVEIMTAIVASHDLTQEQVDAKIKTLAETTENLLESHGTAVAADSHWVACVEEEKATLVTAEGSLGKLDQKKHDQVAPCANEASERAYEHPAPKFDPFACTLSRHGNECETELQTYQEAVRKWISDTKGEVQQHVTDYSDAKQLCVTANQAIVTAAATLATDQGTWSEQKARCERDDFTRLSKICHFGQKLQVKCTARKDFENEVRDVEGTGTPRSESDRKNEWKAATLAKCVLSNYLEKDEHGANASQVDCEAAANYTREVGEIDLHIPEHNALTSIANYTCEEVNVSFNGTSWQLPPPGSNKSSEYHFLNSWSVDVESTHEETAPFGFCQEGEEVTCTSFTDVCQNSTLNPGAPCHLDIGCTAAECCS